MYHSFQVNNLTVRYCSVISIGVSHPYWPNSADTLQVLHRRSSSGKGRESVGSQSARHYSVINNLRDARGQDAHWL